MSTELAVERAEPKDLDTVLDILSEAARWIRLRGINQWPDPFPAERITPALERGETYLAWLGRQAVATVTLQWSDSVFWGDRPRDAGYVHRMAVRREVAGVGPQLLDWAEDQVLAAGRSFLRLDCMTENATLRRYYERQGFVHVGDVAGPGWNASLYERRPAGWSLLSH